MMTRWGLKGMGSFEQASVSRKEELRQVPADNVDVNVKRDATNASV